MRVHDEHEDIDERAVDEIAEAVEDEEEEQELVSLDAPSHATRTALAGEPLGELGDVAAEEDVELGLDVVLRRQTVGDRAFEDLEDRVDGGRQAEEPSPPGIEHTLAPRTADEFLCPACFLVKRRTQLADPATMRCVDCADSPLVTSPHRDGSRRGGPPSTRSHV